MLGCLSVASGALINAEGDVDGLQKSWPDDAVGADRSEANGEIKLQLFDDKLQNFDIKSQPEGGLSRSLIGARLERNVDRN